MLKKENKTIQKKCQEFLEKISNHPDLVSPKDEKSLLMQTINEQSFRTLSTKLGWKTIPMQVGAMGQVHHVIPYLAKKLPKKQCKILIQIKDKIINHGVIEHAREGGKFRGMEVEFY